MARIMAFDYGLKRTGIAVTDDMQIIATALTTVETSQLMTFIKDYVAKETVEQFVVGNAKRLDNSPTHSTALIEKFTKQLKTNFPTVPITLVDERFTSKIAFQTMIDSGLKKKQRANKALVDAISATLILQTFMQQKEIAASRM